jgi:hypothetical protein
MIAHTSDSIVESLLGQLAGLVWRVENLVVEHGEVQGKAETDRVGGGEVLSGDLGGSFIGLKRHVGGSFALVTNGKLGEVAVVVALPI